MKRAILLVIVGVAIGGVGVWVATREPGHGKPDPEDAPAQKPTGDEEEKTTTTHDAEGNVVIKMSDETQGNIGIVVKNPVATNLAVEVKAYGRVVDPASFSALMSELATAEATYSVSSN